MSVSSRTRIPREITDYILEELDVPTLSALTLLSRRDEWRFAARDALFKYVTTFDELKDESRSVSAFRVFLEPSPDVVRSIQNLTIHGEEWHNVQITSRELASLIPQLPELRNVELKNVWLKLNSHNLDYKEITPQHLHSLTFTYVFFELDIEGLSTSTAATPSSHARVQCSFTELFTIFTGLETLELYSAQFIWHSALEDQEGVDLSAIAAAEAAKIPLTSHLKQLLLRTGLPDPYTLFVLQILSCSRILHGLQSFNVYHTVPIGEFNGLMGTFGQNLRTLNLTMPWFCIGNHKVCPVKSRVIALTYLALFSV